MEINWFVPAIALAFICFDVITGFAQALKNKDVQSQKMRDGLFHKLGFLFAIALGYMIEFAMVYMELGFVAPVAGLVCAYVVVTEIVSILENIVALNPDLAGSKVLDILTPKE